MIEMAYVAHIDDGPQSGVGKKVLSQCKAFAENLNGRCVLYVLMSSSRHLSNWEFAATESTPVVCVEIGQSFFSRQINSFRLLAALAKQCPSVGYMRYVHFYIGVYFCLKRFPFVYEINSDDLSELRKRTLVWLYQRLMRGFYLRNVVAMVFVSKFLQQSSAYSCFGKKSIVIGNGYDDSKVDWDGFAAASREIDIKFDRFERNVFFLGSSDQEWQGVDKILYLSKRMPNVGFHLVGAISSDASALDNVHVYGYLPLERYQYLIARCDVAFGPLALHRKNMSSTSALKVAEYILFRKPVILSYKEEDFVGNENFILQIKNTESNVVDQFDEISNFIQNAPFFEVSMELIKKMSVVEKNRIRSAFVLSFSNHK